MLETAPPSSIAIGLPDFISQDYDDYTPEALLGTLRWALGVFPQHDVWRRLQRAGMQQDHSWDSSARAYVKVYERARG